MPGMDYVALRQWLAKDLDHQSILFRVYNPGRARNGSAHAVLSWIALVERVMAKN